MVKTIKPISAVLVVLAVFALGKPAALGAQGTRQNLVTSAEVVGRPYAIDCNLAGAAGLRGRRYRGP